jgi:hypothetical protein
MEVIPPRKRVITEWFHAADNQVAGPMGVEAMTESAVDGVIAPDTLVWSNKHANPKAALDVPEVAFFFSNQAMCRSQEVQRRRAIPVSVLMLGWMILLVGGLLTMTGLTWLLFSFASTGHPSWVSVAACISSSSLGILIVRGGWQILTERIITLRPMGLELIGGSLLLMAMTLIGAPAAALAPLVTVCLVVMAMGCACVGLNPRYVLWRSGFSGRLTH